ncbi:hypothetical protein FRX31_031965 [Thalictrum thalictroides]|uniref:Uncharacterized protein n=1 Tax=Thalictrum thalictroides TaxID=46969 RepID=A0A7J6V0I9_THATH|nr:hypothetical protein FRX31_031965 [Thalictrum thalictroides]
MSVQRTTSQVDCTLLPPIPSDSTNQASIRINKFTIHFTYLLLNIFPNFFCSYIVYNHSEISHQKYKYIATFHISSHYTELLLFEVIDSCCIQFVYWDTFVTVVIDSPCITTCFGYEVVLMVVGNIIITAAPWISCNRPASMPDCSHQSGFHLKKTL